MTRPSNTTERRRQIVEALLRVVADRGYTGATMPAVAAEAGLAPGLIHYHFKSKEEILVELYRYLIARVRERMRVRARLSDDGWQRLEAFIDAHLAIGEDADRDAVRCWVVLSAEALHSSELRPLHRRVLRWQLRRIRELILRLPGRRVDDVEARRAAAALVAAIHGYFQVAATLRGAIPKGTAARSVRQMARGLLTGT